jgi:hypothetical protein
VQILLIVIRSSAPWNHTNNSRRISAISHLSLFDKRLSNQSPIPYFCQRASGITLAGGYNEKLPALCDVILRRMVNFEVKDDRFEIYREQYARSYQNFEKEQPYQHAMYHQV